MANITIANEPAKDLLLAAASEEKLLFKGNPLCTSVIVSSRVQQPRKTHSLLQRLQG